MGDRRNGRPSPDHRPEPDQSSAPASPETTTTPRANSGDAQRLAIEKPARARAGTGRAAKAAPTSIDRDTSPQDATARMPSVSSGRRKGSHSPLLPAQVLARSFVPPRRQPEPSR